MYGCMYFYVYILYECIHIHLFMYKDRHMSQYVHAHRHI